MVILILSVVIILIHQKIKNYHYDYCRQLGQLKGTKIQIVSDRAMKHFVEAKHQKGTKLGDIKTRILTKSMGWSDILLKGA